jgi:hypothetical protein
MQIPDASALLWPWYDDQDQDHDPNHDDGTPHPGEEVEPGHGAMVDVAQLRQHPYFATIGDREGWPSDMTDEQVVQRLRDIQQAYPQILSENQPRSKDQDQVHPCVVFPLRYNFMSLEQEQHRVASEAGIVPWERNKRIPMWFSSTNPGTKQQQALVRRVLKTGIQPHLPKKMVIKIWDKRPSGIPSKRGVSIEIPRLLQMRSGGGTTEVAGLATVGRSSTDPTAFSVPPASNHRFLMLGARHLTSRVILHEMMHVLGAKDVCTSTCEQPKYESSVMNNQAQMQGLPAEKLSAVDIRWLRQMYGD